MQVFPFQDLFTLNIRETEVDPARLYTRRRSPHFNVTVDLRPLSALHRTVYLVPEFKVTCPSISEFPLNVMTGWYGVFTKKKQKNNDYKIPL